MANKKKKKQDSSSTLAAALVAGSIGALIGLFVLGRGAKNGAAGVYGAIDRALGLPSGDALDGGSTAADLTLDQPHHGPGDRAPTDFRPDPTAAVNPRKRDGLAPAALPNPMTAEPVL